MSTVAIAIFCKTPAPGQSKTRLSPLLSPEQCAALSGCVIRDVSATVQALADDAITGYAAYTPRGSEDALRTLVPAGFRLMAQEDGDLGARMFTCISDLLAAGHAGAVLIGADMPTLPSAILRGAVDAVRGGDCLALSPALDGGYVLIGLSRPYATLFTDMPWGTGDVCRLTLQRANALVLPVVNLPSWYDVDDAASLAMLQDELRGRRPPFAAPGLIGGHAPATREFLQTLR